MISAPAPNAAFLATMADLLRSGDVGSQAVAQTLFLQRPDAHLPLMRYEDTRVAAPAIDATVDLYPSLSLELRESLTTFDG